MDIFLLYLFTRIDELRGLLDLIAFGGTVLFGAGMFIRLMGCPDDEFKPFLWTWRLCAVAAGIGLAGKVLVPSQKDLALIVGGKLAIEAAQSPTAKKVYTIVDDMLDEQLAKIAKRKEKQ
jgi:hypothetical protein